MHPSHVPLPRRSRPRPIPLAGTLLVVCLQTPAGLASDALSSAPNGAMPPDVRAALAARSDAAELRARDLDDRVSERERLRRGLLYAVAVTPSLDADQDLRDPSDVVTFEPDLLVDAHVTYRYDSVARLAADAGVERAAARLRAQLRSDVEFALLTLSRLRVAERALQEARSERDMLAAADRGARAGSAFDPAVADAETALARATLAFDEAAFEVDALRRTLTALDVAPGAAWHPVAFAVPPLDAARHPRARLLELGVAQAAAREASAAWAMLDEIELTATYEQGGATARGRLAWERGTPEATLGMRWSPDDDHGWGVGMAATLRFDHTSVDAAALGERELADARAELGAFLTGIEVEVALSLRNVDLAWRAVALADIDRQRAADAADVAAAAGNATASERAATRLRRAEDALERAWQGYVRAFADHLETLDVTWPAP